jgi:hypothetical protein
MFCWFNTRYVNFGRWCTESHTHGARINWKACAHSPQPTAKSAAAAQAYVAEAALRESRAVYHFRLRQNLSLLELVNILKFQPRSKIWYLPLLQPTMSHTSEKDPVRVNNWGCTMGRKWPGKNQVPFDSSDSRWILRHSCKRDVLKQHMFEHQICSAIFISRYDNLVDDMCRATNVDRSDAESTTPQYEIDTLHHQKWGYSAINIVGMIPEIIDRYTSPWGSDPRCHIAVPF